MTIEELVLFLQENHDNFEYTRDGDVELINNGITFLIHGMPYPRTDSPVPWSLVLELTKIVGQCKVGILTLFPPELYALGIYQLVKEIYVNRYGVALDRQVKDKVRKALENVEL